MKLVQLLHSKKHLGTTLSARDAFLDFSYICKDLNSKRNSPSKDIRTEIIIEWLKTLTDIPSIEAKAELQAKIKKL